MQNELNTSLIIAAATAFTTICALTFAVIIALRFLNHWQERGYRQTDIEDRKLEIEKMRLENEQRLAYEQAKIRAAEAEAASRKDEDDDYGFSFIDIEEVKKDIFVNAMMGFEDYTLLKGYNVKVHFKTSVRNKVGIKIVINDIGPTVSREKTAIDANEFINKILSDDDFSEMPTSLDSNQQAVIVKALNIRHALMKQRALISKEAADAYKELLEDSRKLARAAVTYAKPASSSYIQIEASGGHTMRDSFSNHNSPGAIQGRGNTAIGNAISVGSTASERAGRVNGLGKLIDLIEQSSIDDQKKKDIIRYLANSKEEIDSTGDVDKEGLFKWLGRAKTLIDLGGATPELIEGAKKVFDMFGDSSSWPTINV